jgi:carboxypeptidase C (cathepsin A)
MYVPFTANAVLTGNKDAAKINIKLKGILIGNGLLVTDEPNFYSKTQTDYYVNRNLFDYRTKEAL